MTRRSTAGIAAAAALLAAGFAVCGPSRQGDGAATGWETQPATRGPVSAHVSATGTLSPLVEVQVGSQVSGRIQELFADFNASVTKGQVIARIDPRLFETEVARARANVVAAEAAVTRAEANLLDARLRNERATGLHDRGMGSRADAETTQAVRQAAQADVASARAALAQALAALQQAETNLGYTTIYSPIDGVVISRDVAIGQTVAASLQTPTLFTIAEDLRKMEVHTHVAEADVGRLAPGMAVDFGVDAYPSERFRGTIKEVRYSPETVQNVVTYDAVVSVENPERKLRPGMTAEVVFVVEQRDDALLVPSAALRFVPPPETLASVAPPPEKADDGERTRVIWVLGERGIPRPVRIRVGISDGRVAEVAGGDLVAGDQVIVGRGDGAASDRRPTFGRFL
jgi:HlyD family secretion protein